MGRYPEERQVIEIVDSCMPSGVRRRGRKWTQEGVEVRASVWLERARWWDGWAFDSEVFHLVCMTPEHPRVSMYHSLLRGCDYRAMHNRFEHVFDMTIEGALSEERLAIERPFLVDTFQAFFDRFKDQRSLVEDFFAPGSMLVVGHWFDLLYLSQKYPEYPWRDRGWFTDEELAALLAEPRPDWWEAALATVPGGATIR